MMAVVSVGSLWSTKMCAVDSPVIAPRSRASFQTSNCKAIQATRVMRAGPYEATEHFKTLLIRENLIKDARTLERFLKTTYIHEASVARQDDVGFHDGGTNNANDMDVSRVALSRSISTQTSLRKIRV